MDRQVTERLIGAIVLVAVGVVVIPELLSGRRSVEPESRPLRLPAPQGAVLETRTITLGEAPVDSSGGAAPTTPAEVDAAAADGAGGEPSPSPPTPSAESEQATPAPEPGGWVVQIGSFSDRTNAERLVAELRSAGYSAFLSETSADGRLMHRVRVGPEQDRARAEAMAERLRRAGHSGQVLNHP